MIDLTGQRFGRLTVLGQNQEPYRSPSGKPTRRWDCSCDCGTRTTILQSQLTSGKAKSCGCLQREKAALSAADLCGKRYGKWTALKRVPLEKPTANGTKSGWLCRCDCGTERVVLARNLVSGATKSCGCDTAQKALGRIQGDNVLGRYDGTVLSAINPKRGANKNSKTGVRGVYYSQKEGCYIAKIGLRRKSIMLGRFATIEAAEKERESAEEEYYKPLIEKEAEMRAKMTDTQN